MIVNPKLRFMLRHQVTFHTARSRGEPLSLIADHELDILTVLQRAVETGAASLTLRNRDVLRLTKIDSRVDFGVIACLFRRSDPDATVPFFEDLPTGILRKADKKPQEAVSASAHVFIKLQPVSPHKYEVLVEEVEGVSKTYIQQLLIDILRDVEYESNDDRGRPILAKTIPELVGHNHERLGGDAAGEIEFVELVRPGNTDGLDEAGIKQHQEKMVLRIERNSPDKIGIVRRIQEWAWPRGWAKVKVKIKLPDDKSRLVSVARGADAADVLFVKAIRVDLDTELDACSEVISDELLTHSVRILNECV